MSLMNKRRLGVSTLTWSKLPVLTAIEKAKELDFDWIDLGMLNDWTDVNPHMLVSNFEETVSAIEEKLEKTGLRIASINSGFGKTMNQLEKQCLALCSTAKRLAPAAGVILPSGNLKDGWDKGLETLETAYRIFREQGVNLMVETHCFHFTEKIEDTLRLLERIPDLRLTLDASHYIVQGYQPEDWEKLLPWVDHCHIRPCGTEGFETIQVELEDATALSLTWPESMTDWNYKGLFTLEIIDKINVTDAEKATVMMRNELLGNR